MFAKREGKDVMDMSMTENQKKGLFFSMETLSELQKQMGKKQSFESSVISLSHLVLDLYPSSSPSDKKLIYSTVCRAGTLLKTRYTGIGFWMAGLQLFEATLKVAINKDETENMKSLIAKAHEIIGDSQENASMPRSIGGGGFLFEGQLTVDPEPPRPTWMVAQNVLAALASEQERRGANLGQTSETGLPQMEELLTPEMQELMERVNGVSDFGPELEEVIQASLQEVGLAPRGKPPASKEEVAKLVVTDVTEPLIKLLGEDAECAVCKEHFILGAKMQEMPCKHLFHPECLKPWLDEHNSCPICRYELRTDDHDYESKKERDKEFEEEKKGAENALPGGEFMYI